MCPCRFTSCNKCSALVGAVNNGKGYAGGREQKVCEKSSMPSVKFCYKYEMTKLKKKKHFSMFSCVKFNEVQLKKKSMLGVK